MAKIKTAPANQASDTEICWLVYKYCNNMSHHDKAINKVLKFLVGRQKASNETKPKEIIIKEPLIR